MSTRATDPEPSTAGEPAGDRLLELIAERAGADRAEAVRAFAQAYLRRLAADGVAEEELASEVLGAFALAAERGTAPAAVRAFNPTLAEHGYAPAGSVLETNTDDLPFLVDSVTGALHAQGVGLHRVLHPIIGTERGDGGRILRVLHPRDAPARESVMHFELDRRLSQGELEDLAAAVRRVLDDVHRVVADFPLMRARIRRMSEFAREGTGRYGADEVADAIAFLEWLEQDNFVFLGYREYELTPDALRVAPGSGLGILADHTTSSFAQPVPLADLDPALRSRVLEGELLVVAKTNRLAPVHRRARMDYVGLRHVAPDGASAGEARLVGLFTSKAYVERASETPPLQRKLRRILEAEDLIVGSHDYKAAVALFDAFPKDELFAAPVEDLSRAIVALLGLHGDEVRLLGRTAPDGRSISLIAALPRDRYDAELVERLAERFRARFRTGTVDHHLVLGESDRARIHFIVHAPAGGLPPAPFPDLQRELVELTRSWEDRLAEGVAARHGPARALEIAQRWAPLLPEAYRAATDPALAVEDVECFERLQASAESFVVGVRNEARDGRPLTRIGLYKRGGKAELSAFMPILEALGLHVVEEQPTRLEDGEHTLQDFGVLGPDSRQLDLEGAGGRLVDCVAAVFRGEAESDALNELVLTAGLDWRQVAVLRAYRKYRQRVGSRFTERYQNEVLTQNAPLVAKLVRLFELRFDPSRPRDQEGESELRREILGDLDEVASLDHDRILRNHLGLVDATLRTNAFRSGRRVLSLKLRSAAVPAMPRPAPLFEIYVYSAEMEGIHLRDGLVARGGIRWSDRMDYRTEVYGLMRAQVTKNAVIVPTGAKGGFYLKRLPADPGARAAEVERRYVDYVSGLLDLTDNLAGGRVVHPAGVRVLDEADAYLVVAADKGTATLSDTANAVGESYGFWLGDGFASGGSAGYDHKRLGITARGAWESVKRHFGELGLDPARDEFTVVGIGDMSGDVFGNGMLLSDRIRLVAAYDHRHVFIDPNPDASASHAERRRLFGLPASSWADYDPKLISAGGGVWPRSAKQVQLTPQARAALEIEDESLTPAELIRAILRAPVDLLWNGGIGTVVKASSETDDDAQDRASDAIRVNGDELRCRVVAEGGNLGLTQRARIEYARGGGRVNADFIDNSAGVSCSDHEVNLKILLGIAEAAGRLTRAERDPLLVEVTEDVTAHVLYGSFLQAQILSQEVEASSRRLDAYEDLMQTLEHERLIDRAIDALPSGEEMAERRHSGLGMTRPELAVLLAHAKRSLAGALLASPLPDDPYLQGLLRGYFPPAVVERFGDLLGEHPLRRELAATIAANEVVDSLGPTFASRLVGERGIGPADVVRAYLLARATTLAAERWAAVERLGRSLPRELAADLMAGADEVVEATARWYLLHAPAAGLDEVIAEERPAFVRLAGAIAELCPPAWRLARAEAELALVAQGVGEDLARAHVHRRELALAPDMAFVAQQAGLELDDVARAFLLLDERLRMAWLEAELDRLAATTRWQRWAVEAVRDDLLLARRELALGALAAEPGDVEAAVERLLATHAMAAARLESFLRSLEVEGADLAGLTLAVRQLRSLAA